MLVSKHRFRHAEWLLYTGFSHFSQAYQKMSQLSPKLTEAQTISRWSETDRSGSCAYRAIKVQYTIFPQRWFNLYDALCLVILPGPGWQRVHAWWWTPYFSLDGCPGGRLSLSYTPTATGLRLILFLARYDAPEIPHHCGIGAAFFFRCYSGWLLSKGCDEERWNINQSWSHQSCEKILWQLFFSLV